MEAIFITDTAQYILTIIRSGGPVAWSWGPSGFKATVYREMAALEFYVSGFIHKGKVIVAYNRGADTFEVYCLNQNEKIIDSRNNVYFDELVNIIDGMVEKKCSKEEYKDQIINWFKEKQL